MRLLTVPGVFRPRSDSLMLARRIAAEVEPGQVVLDPFSGSGVLAITAALAGAKATAVDISRRAVACAWSNARLNGTRIRARCGDMFAPVAEEQFDLIVANPPYLPAVSDAAGAGRCARLGGRDRRPAGARPPVPVGGRSAEARGTCARGAVIRLRSGGHGSGAFVQRTHLGGGRATARPARSPAEGARALARARRHAQARRTRGGATGDRRSSSWPCRGPCGG